MHPGYTLHLDSRTSNAAHNFHTNPQANAENAALPQTFFAQVIQAKAHVVKLDDFWVLALQCKQFLLAH